jgi:anaerobic selenocysteine-containing dehydrogenase
MVGVRGRAMDRINRGRLGPKGLYASWQWSDQDRLTRPLVRRNGELVEASWEEAMDRIVAESRRRHPLQHGFYTSGQLFLEEYYVLAVIGKAGLGTPHMDGNTRLCTATAAAALKESFVPTGSRPATTTSTSATRCSCSGTTWPPPRLCCGPGCSIASRGQINRSWS